MINIDSEQGRKDDALYIAQALEEFDHTM